MKIGVMYGSPETTTGGNALKFYASVRLDIRRIGAIKDREEVVGNQTRVKVVKNKVAPPFKQVEFDIMYGEGVSKNGELIDLGVKAGVVEKSGAWFSFDSTRLGQGRENAKTFLKANPEIAGKIEALIRENVTGLPIVPTISAVLLQMDLSKFEFPNLRYITSTAAALPLNHISRLRTLFPNVKLFSMYGLTECKRVSYLPPDQIDIRPGSVGRGMPNEEVYLIDDRGARLGPGEVGELVVRGSNVMRGYWNLPEETSKMLKSGPLPGELVLHTGDLFRTDAEGYLYFVGRTDDIVKCRGEKVSPREIEDALFAMPEVVEAAVIGVPDPIQGDAIVAFAVLRPGVEVTPRDLLRHCSENLEEYLVPQRVIIVPTLPKSNNGKIDKHELARLLEA